MQNPLIDFSLADQHFSSHLFPFDQQFHLVLNELCHETDWTKFRGIKIFGPQKSKFDKENYQFRKSVGKLWQTKWKVQKMAYNLQVPEVPPIKRYSIDTDELVKRIHASKPKSVFLDAKPKMTNQRTFGKKSKIDVTEQGLQSIKRAAFATETSNEVENVKFDSKIFENWNKFNVCVSGYCV